MIVKAKIFKSSVRLNLAGFLYDQNSFATVTLNIVGDPAWIAQGGTAWGSSRSGFSYEPFLADGSINIDAANPFFELSFNTPSDYDFETGIIKPTGNDTPPTQQLVGKNVRNASETYRFLGTIQTTLLVNQSTLTNPVILSSEDELLYFFTTSARYATLTQTMEIKSVVNLTDVYTFL